MGNSSTKETHSSSAAGQADAESSRRGSLAGQGPASPGLADRHSPALYRSHGRRTSGLDLSLLSHRGDTERDSSANETRRETRAEREARKLEKERAVREKERERSLREEGVDGGYLVTLGTYTGPEDFNKTVVRQLMIERRLAPFWKGLNDYSDSWTEHQLVAAARGLPIPAPDEIPEELRSIASCSDSEGKPADANRNTLSVPISSNSPSNTSSPSLSPLQPAFSLPSPSSPFGSPSTSSPLFRGRAKTLASLTTSSRSNSQTEMVPQEIHLPREPHINGQPVEVFLYKDASECPICFLYYPPYLNKTRCCDQPICSECFVQIKRPDPHPPEHMDPNAPDAGRSADSMLVSEPAACPFCVQPEFGVTYEPPPFRRGLAYANHSQGHPLANVTSAMSSSSSLGSQTLGSNGITGRRRTTSISANAPAVITTDRIRPDWAKKLSDARAHAMRRSAAATALHNAAYVLGSAGGPNGRGFALGRRRRTLFAGNGSDDQGMLNLPEGLTLEGNLGAIFAAAGADRSLDQPVNDIFPSRSSSRRTRVEELEELMMMEAIRQSLAAEEERKRKEEKEAAKEAKKEEKKKAKEAKKIEKSSRKSGFYSGGSNASYSSHAFSGNSSAVEGKGKAVDRPGPSAAAPYGFSQVANANSPSSATGSGGLQDRQRQNPPDRLAELSASGEFNPFLDPPEQPGGSNASTGSSSVSSIADSSAESPQNEGSPALDSSSITAGNDATGNHEAASVAASSAASSSEQPMLNFRSIAAMMVGNSASNSGSGATSTERIAAATPDSEERNGRGDVGESSILVSTAQGNNPVEQGHGYQGEGSATYDSLDASATTVHGGEDDSNHRQNDRDFYGGPDTGADENKNPYDMKRYGDIAVSGDDHQHAPVEREMV